jgi:hypothetical protein
MIEILEHAAIEILRVVDCNWLQNFITIDDVLPEKLLYICRGYTGGLMLALA